MSKIIIGIHGMGNKPNCKLLQKWWKESLKEGLKLVGKHHLFRFKLVYWAPVLYASPLDESITDKKNPLYLEERYQRGGDKTAPFQSNLRKKMRNRLNVQVDNLLLDEDGTLRFKGLTGFILKNFVKDIDVYYGRNLEDNSRTEEKDAICKLLADKLRRHKRKKILLIAHSMGSIIALDVLNEYAPDVKIHTLVTIGSPLGIPVIRGRMLREQGLSVDGKMKALTPENIEKAWYNLSDFEDKVAFNYELQSDFIPNGKGISPQDELVWNNYEFKGEENHHKSYGYLRCPEMAGAVSNFLRFRFFNK